MFNLNCQRIEQRETIKNSCSLIKKLEWKSKGKPQSDLCAGKAGGSRRGWRVVLRLRVAHVTIRAMTKINTRLWPQPFTAGKWDEIGEWDAKTGTAETLEEGGLGLVVLCSTWKIYWRWAMLFKGMRPLREYHVSFDYVLSCWQCWSVVSSPPTPLLVVYSVGNAGRKEKLAIERRLLISLPHIVLYNPTEPGPDTAIWQWERIFHSKLCRWQAQKDSTRTQRTRRAETRCRL